MGLDYNDIIRNKIRDFIGGKNWSVSSFAARYVDAFIELYSRQEAPSTSTARKLVEEDGHVYSEREVTVLDYFTKQDFYATWLEGQKAIVIEKSEQYYGIKSKEAQIDSPDLLAAHLKKSNDSRNVIPLNEIFSLADRYFALSTSMPLVLISPSISNKLIVITRSVNAWYSHTSQKYPDELKNYSNKIILNSPQNIVMTKKNVGSQENWDKLFYALK